MANWKWFSVLHTKVFALTGGRVGGRLAGIDMVFVDTIGRKTGAVHTVPIACYPYEGDIAVVASNNGQDTDPNWWKNLKANPEVTVQQGTDRYRARAEEITGAARDAFWPTVLKLNRTQAHHEKATKRVLPLVRLRRIAG